MVKVIEVAGNFVIAWPYGGWRPGIFASKKAARYAGNAFTDEEIETFLGPIYRFDGEDRPVTLSDVHIAAGVIEDEMRNK